jgi:type IV secretory pathway VirB6-like protein
MGSTSDTLFETLWNGYNSSLSTGVAASVTSGLSVVATWMTGVMGMYVLVTGVLIITGSITYGSGIRRILRALLVVAALVPVQYNTYVVTAFTETIPNAIASSAGGTGSSNSVNAAQVFDQLLNADEAILAQTLAAAGSSPFNVGKIISAYVATALAEVSLLGAFLIWWLAYALVNVVVCVGPYVVPFWLFDSTRSIPERLFGKLIGYMVLMLMVMITTQIVQSQEKTYVSGFATQMATNTATPGPTQSPGFVAQDGTFVQPGSQTLSTNVGAGAGNVDEDVSMLWKIALAFGFGALLLFMLPPIAAYIGGGVAVNMAPIVSTAARVLTGR